MQNDQENKTTTTVRPRRTPISRGRNITTVEGKEPGFYYRIFNDVGDRIEAAKQRGYEVVTHDVKVGDTRVVGSRKPGSAVTLSMGNGIKGVLMRIPQAFKDEDDRAKAAEVDATEEAIVGRVDPRTGERQGDYGSVTINK